MVKRSFAIAMLVIMALVGACGFRPLYLETRNFSVIEELALTRIQAIPDRRGQIVRNALIDRMNPRGEPAHPKYRLATSINESIHELAVRRDDSSTRANLILVARFQLYQEGIDQPILEGRVQSVNSHSISVAEVATLGAEKSARERGARDIAERMVLQIGAFFDSVDRNLGSFE